MTPHTPPYIRRMRVMDGGLVSPVPPVIRRMRRRRLYGRFVFVLMAVALAWAIWEFVAW